MKKEEAEETPKVRERERDRDCRENTAEGLRDRAGRKEKEDSFPSFYLFCPWLSRLLGAPFFLLSMPKI